MKLLIIFLFLHLCNFSNMWLLPEVMQNIIIDHHKSGNRGKIWALLVAGSNGYYNYRHQADICHAYQILHENGIPDENIIVMMFDDIANNTENPTPGIIVNHPNGSDVYKGVLKDYTGKDVTPENFLNILQGNSVAMRGVGSGRVIQSGPADSIFVNFADHGAPGIVAFPSSELGARALNDAIFSMFMNNQYYQMVVYIEACESGSMFENLLPPKIRVFATTAANSHESSYACYFDSLRQTYLGDVYSVKWMEDSEIENTDTESLEDQFRIVKQETNTSHVQEFGQLDMGKIKLSHFLGHHHPRQKKSYPAVKFDAVPSPDVPLKIVENKIKDAQLVTEIEELKQKLFDLQKNRHFLANTVRQIVDILAIDMSETIHFLSMQASIKDWDCYENSIQYFQEKCFILSKNPYALRHLYVLVNLCESGHSFPVISAAMDKICTHSSIEGIV